MRKEQEPTERKDYKSPISDSVHEHPAFGQIRVSRVNGDTTLYGSDFVHRNFITLHISKSELHRGLNHDSYFAREEIVEVALSEAQWATLVSSFNIGSGVPCTLQHIGREMLPSIPFRKVETVAQDELKADIKKLTDLVNKAIAEAEGAIGMSLSKAKRDVLLESLLRFKMEVESNLPFAARSFAKHMETSVEKAKVEVHAYMNAVVTNAGLSALASIPPLRLEAGNKEKGSAND